MRGLAGLAPHTPPEPPLPAPRLRVPPSFSDGRRMPHFPLLALALVPHLFGAGRDEAVLLRLPQLTVLTLENGRPDQSCIRLPPNGLNRQPLLPHFANPIPSRIAARCQYPYLCGTRPKKKTTMAAPSKREASRKKGQAVIGLPLLRKIYFASVTVMPSPVAHGVAAFTLYVMPATSFAPFASSKMPVAPLREVSL